MAINIITFGQLTDVMGKSISVENIPDTETLVRELHSRYPGLVGVKYVIAVDKEIIQANTLLNADSAVALLPPFAGG
jgi:molybdopterin synthase sulfur carrier subunit